ncbi:MAG TPA: sigma-70 family RNA polymerase sigma factor [Terriglobales bacterium]|nr:sigma-70 family RNA polymerase sigma factor [Terriglobales bacterium]
MLDETGIGGRGGKFPPTRQSLVVAVRGTDAHERRRAMDVFISNYWKPVYKYIRLRWGKDNEQAKDLTQEFFTRVLEKDFLDSYDPARARLRTFVRVCLDRFLANADNASQRLKRGGDTIFVSLDFESAEGELQHLEPAAKGNVEEFFAREWTRSLFSNAVEQLRQECEGRGKQTHFRLFELYDVEEGGKELTYEEAGRLFGLKASDVTNYLAYARREFRRIVLESLREMTASDEEYRSEARSLLGIEI